MESMLNEKNAVRRKFIFGLSAVAGFLGLQNTASAHHGRGSHATSTTTSSSTTSTSTTSTTTTTIPEGEEVDSLALIGVEVHLVRTGDTWTLPNGDVPDLTNRQCVIVWEGKVNDIPPQGTNGDEFRNGDLALIRPDY